MRIRVRGESMRPTLSDGDEVEIALSFGGAVSRARVGDVVLVLQGTSPVLHRVVSRTADGGVITWGDGARMPDPPVGAERILGTAAVESRPIRARIRWMSGAVRFPLRRAGATILGTARKSLLLLTEDRRT